MLAMSLVFGGSLVLALLLMGLFARAMREADDARTAMWRGRQMWIESNEPQPVPDIRRYRRMRTQRRLQQLRRQYGRRTGGSAA